LSDISSERKGEKVTKNYPGERNKNKRTTLVRRALPRREPGFTPLFHLPTPSIYLIKDLQLNFNFVRTLGALCF
jgi:hypothetical protein